MSVFTHSQSEKNFDTAADTFPVDEKFQSFFDEWICKQFVCWLAMKLSERKLKFHCLFFPVIVTIYTALILIEGVLKV